MEKKLLLLFVFAIILSQAFSQTIIKGTVRSAEDSATMPGVSVVIKGTTTGAITDINGKYQISVPKDAKQLVFSFMGYAAQTVDISGQTNINIILKTDVKQLGEIVVTALGIKREKKALGYSVQEVSGDNLQTAKDPNLINELAGKVAGMEVSATTGSAGSSSRIVLRGNRSFEYDNQALIVIDGVPVDNKTVNTTNEWGGYDYGNGISDINPDDIESVSVLKGPSASALYGSLASNGVVLITTKKGKARNGIGVSLNSSTTFEDAYILDKFQNTYGAGTYGGFNDPWVITNGIPVYNTASKNAFGSWGPKMQGQTIVDWDGQTRAFNPQPNNYKDFYQTGITANNTVSIDGGSDKVSFRISLNSFNNKDIVPKTTLDKINISAKIDGNITSRWTVDVSVNYINQKAHNRLGLANSYSAPRNIIMMPRNISDASLKNDYQDANGVEQVWYTNWNWMSNPYWDVNYETNDDVRNRMINIISTTYKFNDFISLMLRANNDFHNTEYTNIQAYNGVSDPQGSCSKSWDQYFQQNYDLLLSFNKNIGKMFKVSCNAGGNVLINSWENNGLATIGGLKEPYFYNPTMGLSGTSISYSSYKKQINSIFAAGQVAFKDYLFIDLTGRNDWSSTLPAAHDSYFYPSVSGSFVFSDAFKIDSKVFSFGKVRLSWAEVGNDTDPYKLDKTYSKPDNPFFNGSPTTYVTTTIPNRDLKPERTYSEEAGTDLRFFKNRVGLDITYYYAATKDQILSADVSSATGSSQAVVNSGEVDNKGFEVQLKSTPVKTKSKFQWDLIVNYAKNQSEVVSLNPGLESKVLLSQWNLTIEARPGHPYGDIVGYSILRDASGNEVLNDTTHLPKRGPQKVLGNTTPKWIGSISNSFSYKSISLSFLIDIKWGGQMFAGSDMYGYGYSGNFAETVNGRDAWYASEAARVAAGVSTADWVATGGQYVEGVLPNGKKWSGYVDPEKYWGNFSEWTQEIHEPFIYDASYIKLREATITWTLPAKFTEKIKLKGASISIVGRNLWTIYKKVPNIDPETAYTNGNGQGYEIYSYPVRRSVGFDIKISL